MLGKAFQIDRDVDLEFAHERGARRRRGLPISIDEAVERPASRARIGLRRRGRSESPVTSKRLGRALEQSGGQKGGGMAVKISRHIGEPDALVPSKRPGDQRRHAGGKFGRDEQAAQSSWALGDTECEKNENGAVGALAAFDRCHDGGR